MAQSKFTPVERSLLRLFPSTRIRALARSLGVVKKFRKVDPVAFVWTLVVGFGTGRERTIAGLRRLYQAQTGRRLVPSAFYDRFTPALTRLLRELIDQSFGELESQGAALKGRLSSFKELLAIDSTVVRLADALRKTFPACRTNHTVAALKVHMVMSVFGASPRRIRVTAERAADGKNLKVGPWVAGRLLLFDLGYYSYRLFAHIVAEDGHFISRLKENANPLIVSASDKRFVGKRLQDVLPTLRRDILDAEVEVDFKRRTYGGKRSGAFGRFRMVAVRDDGEGRYHTYLTSVPAETLTAEDVARIYGLRWEVELLFKELKGAYRLEDMPSSKQHITEALLYASLLSLVVSRILLRAARRTLTRDLKGRLRYLRWSAVLRDYAPLLLGQTLSAAGCHISTAMTTFATMLAEAVDPNASRGDLLTRTEALVSS
jgi:IS4 transposase